MRRGIVKSAVLAAGLVLCSASPAQELSARARVDSTRYLIGDWIGVHIEFGHPPAAVLQPLFADTTGGFRVLQVNPVERVTATESKTLLILAAYDSVAGIIPPLPFLATLPGDTVTRKVETNPLLVVVQSVQVDTTQDIRDVKPPLSLPLTFAEILLWVTLLLAVAAAAWWGYRYWKKRKSQRPGPVVAPALARPAHIIALEALAVVKEKHLWQQGLIKQYYSEVSDVIRAYYENRFGFKALEQTTDEILAALQRDPRSVVVLDQTSQMLRLADLVKFAKFQPGVADHEQLMVMAYDIIERTRPMQAAVGHEKGEAYAGA